MIPLLSVLAVLVMGGCAHRCPWKYAGKGDKVVYDSQGRPDYLTRIEYDAWIHKPTGKWVDVETGITHEKPYRPKEPQ